MGAGVIFLGFLQEDFNPFRGNRRKTPGANRVDCAIGVVAMRKHRAGVFIHSGDLIPRIAPKEMLNSQFRFHLPLCSIAKLRAYNCWL